MYSKQDAQRLRQEFWIEFAEKYPRKWILYDTKIKDFALKFYADNTLAQVVISIETRDTEKRLAYFEKLESLKSILLEEYLPDAVFEKDFYLETGKSISKIWVQLDGVSISNRKTWDKIFDFLNDKMNLLELFFLEYEDFIKDV